MWKKRILRHRNASQELKMCVCIGNIKCCSCCCILRIFVYIFFSSSSIRRAAVTILLTCFPFLNYFFFLFFFFFSLSSIICLFNWEKEEEEERVKNIYSFHFKVLKWDFSLSFRLLFFVFIDFCLIFFTFDFESYIFSKIRSCSPVNFITYGILIG